MKFWIVTNEHEHVICTGQDRERVKSEAAQYLGGNPNQYTVTPLIVTGDRVHLNITASV